MDVNKLSDMWEGRLNHVIQYLGFRSWLDFATTNKRTLHSMQHFFKDKLKVFEEEHSLEVNNRPVVRGYARFPDERWARCLLKINAAHLTHWGLWGAMLIKPISFKENGHIVYGWVLGASQDWNGKRDCTTIAGHFRPFPCAISLNAHRKSPAAVTALIPWR